MTTEAAKPREEVSKSPTQKELHGVFVLLDEVTQDKDPACLRNLRERPGLQGMVSAVTS